MPGLRSLRNRLAVVFGLIVAGAIGTVYLSVTPRLEDRLQNQRMGALAIDAKRTARGVPTLPRRPNDQKLADKLMPRVRRTSARLSAEILSALASSPGRVFTRDMLLTRIWGDSAYRDPRTVDVHIRHLREKLEADAKEPEYVFTVRGVGYRFRDEE